MNRYWVMIHISDEKTIPVSWLRRWVGNYVGLCESDSKRTVELYFDRLWMGGDYTVEVVPVPDKWVPGIKLRGQGPLLIAVID